ncbi:MAG: nucleotidyltransferase family protein [Methylocystis sp.]
MEAALEPEFAFLCALVRPHPDHRRALELAGDGLNWAHVERLSTAHGVRPHLLRALNAYPGAGEFSELTIALQRFWRGHAARNLYAAGEIGRIANCFDQRGIDFAAFKGVALAQTLYGDISWREFNDIDIIVRPAYLDAAQSALESCGYRAAQGSGREWRRAFLGYQRQYMFMRADSTLAVDLHWDFFPHDFAFPLKTSEIWRRLDHVSIAARMIPTLDDETLAIYLIGHGAKEGWKSLGWVCDFADFYMRRPHIDWVALSHRLDRGGRERLLVGLQLATKLLGVCVREELLNGAGSDAKIGSQYALALRRLASAAAQKEPHAEFSFAGLELCLGLKERARALWLLAATRTVSDYNAIPLPQPLWRLYHLIRPFRLALKIAKLWIAGRGPNEPSQGAAHRDSRRVRRIDTVRDDLGRG